MADNSRANATTTVGELFCTAEVTFSGDSAKACGTFVGMLTGSEGAYTYTLMVGGAGAVTGGVQRMTLASDDPAVTHLATIAGDTTDIETAVELIDDAIVADDAAFTPATTKVMMAGFEFDDSTPDSVNEGDAGAARMSANRCIYVNIRDNAGNERGLNVDASGNITVNVTGTVTVGSHAVTNAGTFAVQVDGAALTALQLIDDPVATLGTTTYSEATTKGMIVAAVRRDADTTLVDTTNELGPLQMDANGRLKVEVFDSGDSHTVDNAGTFAVQVDGNALTALQLIDNIVHVDDAGFTLGTHSGAMMMGFAGTQSVDANDACALACTTAGALHTAVQSLPASTNTIEVVGDAAHGAAIAGNPVRIGTRALTSNYTAVTAGQTADIPCTVIGKPVIQQYALPGTTFSYATATSGVTDTADDEAKAAGAAGTRNYVTRAQVFNGHASTSTEVVIKSSSTVLWRGWAQAAGGGCSAVFDPPLRGGDAEAINVANITNSSQTYFNLQGYQAAE